MKRVVICPPSTTLKFVLPALYEELLREDKVKVLLCQFFAYVTPVFGLPKKTQLRSPFDWLIETQADF